MREAIDQNTLKALVSAQALRECRIVRYGEGWSLQGRLGASWLPVRSDKKPIRVWLSLTAIGKFCEAMGIRTATLEL